VRKLLSKLWADDRGFIISLELLFIAVILVIGLIAGWAGLRSAIVTEYTELGNSILQLQSGYIIQSVSGDTGGSYGSSVQNTSGLVKLTVSANNAPVTQADSGDTTLTTSLTVVP
jgi:hypothetical protein